MERSSNLLDEALGILDVDHNSYSSSTESLPSASSSGNCVLIQDCVETSAAFVIHHLLKRSLSPHPQSSSAVIFVSLAHPFSHYHRILRKLVCPSFLLLFFIYVFISFQLLSYFIVQICWFLFFCISTISVVCFEWIWST